ncbi:MAG: hypothetical protein ACK5VX_14855, partial [Akkermansiaceae bacterium]
TANHSISYTWKTSRAEIHPQILLKSLKKEVVISPEQQAKYSDAALEVMKKHKVEINDLYAHILPELDKYSLGKNDVHFNREGSDFLAKKVIAAIEVAIKGGK